jgi:hypothetical protein
MVFALALPTRLPHTRGLYRFITTRMVSDLQVHEISYAAW